MSKSSEKIQECVNRCSNANSAITAESYYEYNLKEDLSKFPPEDLAAYIAANYQKLAGK